MKGARWGSYTNCELSDERSDHGDHQLLKATKSKREMRGWLTFLKA